MIAARRAAGSRLKARSTSSRTILRTSSSASPGGVGPVVVSAGCSMRRHLLGRPFQLEQQRPRGGLALLLDGRRPKEWLHLVYALLAFGLVPLADSLAVLR
jgi:hypothetical protein